MNKTEIKPVYDLFNNPMIEAAKKAMTPEQLEDYRIKGELMYANIDFDTNIINNKCNIPFEFRESISYILESIKSGIHPSFLTIDEKKLLLEFVGENWYVKYGYIKEDLDSIVTIENLNLNDN
jgi:hypothetical protein